MQSKFLNGCLLFLLWLPLTVGAGLHHSLEATLHPAQHSIEVQDTVSGFSPTSRTVEFTLHPLLQPESLTAGVRLTALPAPAPGDGNPGVLPGRYRAELPPGQHELTLRYSGLIRHELVQQGEEYARGFSETSGMISTEGVFLSADSHWYPQFDAEPLTFELRLTLPGGWRGMSQGERTERTSGIDAEQEYWRCDVPQEQIYLVAGAFTEYQQTSNGVRAMVLLREPDPVLAQKYLDTTDDYIKMYTDLIGPYPYRKFAMVENFWETGYGMPSFTLLGSRVIRFPFILHSSYPHEILHNWWGNSVYIDYDRGNWAEGLTSYLADHLIKEQRGQGAEHRRDVLQKYTDYVRHQQDFPLTEFRSRHSPVSEAVGYGKTLMLFHMLRQELGDEAFIDGLRRLYSNYKHRVADYAAVQAAFAQAGGRPLAAFFRQWVERRGAPMLRVSQVKAEQRADRHVLVAVIEQTQADAPYRLEVPLAVHLQGREQAWQTRIAIDADRTRIELPLPAAPLRLDVDPEFDLFRRLHREEIPPAISQVFGAERVLIVLPAQAPPALLEAYRSLAQSWQSGKPGQVEVTLDRELGQLPADRAVWLLGWRNRFRGQLTRAVDAYAFDDQGDTIHINDTTLTTGTHSLVVLGRHPDNPDQALGWVATDTAAALAGLGRKLPHYGRYSYLAFTGEAPTNVLKGQWPVVNSPLSVTLAHGGGGQTAVSPATLAPRLPLAAAPAKFSAARLQRDINVLAGPAMSGRGLGTPELDQAAGYIADQFRAAGLQPGGDRDGYLQTWQEPVAVLGSLTTLNNVIGVLPGTDPERAGESLVI
ncbi:MAG: M1 family aminopeptidase, partial [Gammaproteobacteria bacterium]